MTRSPSPTEHESGTHERPESAATPKSAYDTVVQRIVADSRDNPMKYLQETVVPDGGE